MQQNFIKPISIDYISRSQKLTRLTPLLNQPWAILLDSAGKDNLFNRYDIFCFAPSIKLSYQNNITQINTDKNAANFELTDLDLNDPLDCMRQILKRQQLAIGEQISAFEFKNLPFNGGWLGYISYDFGRHLEKLPAIAKDDIQLPSIHMGLYQWAMITDHQMQTTKLYNFGLNQSCWQKIVAQFNHSSIEQKQTEDFSLLTSWQSNTSEKNYLDAFNKIQDYIHSGDCYQVNFAQRFSAQYQGSTILAYQKLTTANQAPFSAFLNFEDHQILSLSPERFIESHQGHVKTQPIKGTRPRNSDPIIDEEQKQSLLNSEKDRAENLMIVDLLRNDLSRTAAKASVKVTELFGHYRFASVHHLISTIESKLATQFDNFDLLATTLPGGSITGAPKIRAMQIIEELEPVRRNLYCGIIGYIDFLGNMDTNICIRTLIAKNNTLYCWAGGGLVADSNASEEYQETFDKLSKILPILNTESVQA